MRPVGLFLSAVLSTLAGPTVAQETYQHDCRFEFVIKVSSAGTQRADVDWRVRAARKGKSGRVVVAGSGDYKSRVKEYPSGAIDFVFKTGVSREVITIGVQGEALWQIDFTNKDFMSYVGTCQPARRTR